MRRDQLSHAWGQGCPNGQCKCVAYCLTWLAKAMIMIVIESECSTSKLLRHIETI
jgi:hypothetical protein